MNLRRVKSCVTAKTNLIKLIAQGYIYVNLDKRLFVKLYKRDNTEWYVLSVFTEHKEFSLAYQHCYTDKVYVQYIGQNIPRYATDCMESIRSVYPLVKKNPEKFVAEYFGPHSEQCQSWDTVVEDILNLLGFDMK